MPPWPSPLADAGYEIIRIEQPVTTEAGKVTVDLLFAARARNALLAIECKDGSVQEEQAKRYQAMAPIDLVRTASVTLPDAQAASLDVAFAVWGMRSESTVRELSGVAPRVGTLAIDTQIAWLGAVPTDPRLRAVFADSQPTDLRAIPRLLPVDDSSPPSAIALAIANELHAAFESGRESITANMLLEGACWGWPRFGRAFQGRLIKAVTEMLRDAEKADLAGLIVVERPTAQSHERVIRLQPRNTEATTQAGELRASRALRGRLDSFVARVTGRPVPPSPGQLDLLSQLEDLEIDDE